MRPLVPLVLVLASCASEPVAVSPADQEYRQALACRTAQEALPHLDLAIQADPRAEFFVARAGVRLSLKRPQEAVEDFTQAIRRRSSDPVLRVSRGSVLFALARYPQAEEDFSEAVRLAPEYVEALLWRAHARRVLGREADADRDVAQARTVGASLADGFYNEGVRALNKGESVEAERMFAFTLDLNPDFSRAHIALARILMERRRFPEAAAEFDQALRWHPKDPELYYHRGNARLAADRGPEALADFDRALDLKPGEASYLAARGLARYRVRQDALAAKADLDLAIQMDKSCYAAWLNRGIIAHERKELDAAERDLRQAGAIHASPEGSIALARVLHDRREYDKALALYRNALAIYKDPEVQKRIQEEAERTRQAKENGR